MNVKQIVRVILSPMFLFTLSAVILLFSATRKRNNFFDIRGIVKDQFKIFHGLKTQLFVFYGVPFLLAFATVRIKRIDETILDNIIIVLSIFLSMLFAMLSIVGSQNNNKNEKRKILIDQTFNSIMFESVLCIVSLIISFSCFFTTTVEGSNDTIVKWIISTILYYLIYTTILNTFIVIKRIKILFENR